ncbi:Low-affinity potassium transport protein [Diplogelasinospora grovesii]|uniref:Potassium transport protein n=1 Tax=Diplogelasinospora grovesii TaxID=303347 RepID=A0AAN6NEW5_9PEZI|nr:Low-affinity potassium transport protein [Diplogelasinospora grovesii]
MENLGDIVIGQLKSMRPSFMSKEPHFNFITAHYFWIIGMTLFGSVLLYGGGRGNDSLAYIDCLFFAAGSNTQAGLNTVDVNLLNTFQQVVLYFLAMMSNPIMINSFVVFLRLYWFEKRFQHLVREARQKRGTISKSKTKAKRDIDDAERGVNGRSITVMHNGKKSRITNDGILLDAATRDKDQTTDRPGFPNANGDVPDGDAVAGPQDNRRSEIKFANTVKRSDGLGDDITKLPPTRSEEEHIAILERQRKRDDEVLRIPGPRDAERGMRPERVQHEADENLEPLSPRRTDMSMETDGAAPRSQTFDRRQQAITIEEPDRHRVQESAADEFVDDARAFAKVFSFLHLRKPRPLKGGKQKLHQEENELHVHQRTTTRASLRTFRTAFSRDRDEGTPYLSWEPTLGRNSAFPDLTEEQREELGGIEYRSLKTLALILMCYFWGFTAFGIVGLTPWIYDQPGYAQLIDNAGQSRTWWGFFTANSAFMDLGFTLTPDSMNSFNTAVWPLLLMTFLIIIGNTGFPVMLRFIIWVMSLVIPRGTGLYEEIRFLLDHPRRCFTLLFPSGATWWLFWLLVGLNGVDLIFFIILDLGSGPVAGLPAGVKILDGLFQAASTRTAGFSVVNLAALHPGVQVSYLIMMYISVFPIAISVRRTNVYEENSLGIYQKNDIDDHAANSDLSYVGAHLRRQLSFDLWYIFVGFFILAITEGPRLMTNDFSMFAVLFEIVSAYGTVGMSLGYSAVNASLSSQFTVVGKLVIVGMMIRGRHRGLPYGLDRAILLPRESLSAKEAADDADARLARRNSHVSVATGVGSGMGGPGPGRGRGGPGLTTVRTRGRSMSGDRGQASNNILTSFLHPGPAKQRIFSEQMHGEPFAHGGIRRRSTDPTNIGGDSEDHPDLSPYASRTSAATARSPLRRENTASFFSPRPQTAEERDLNNN